MFNLRKTVFLLILPTALLVFGTEEISEAQSLFSRRSSMMYDQHRAITATRKGDLLTILINEATDVENIDLRSMDKAGNATATADLNYGLGAGLGGAQGTANINQNSTSVRNFSGDSEFRSERQFNDRFAVVVIDVLPNGNLVVAGKRNISVQEDSRKLTLTGIVRPVDLLPGNAVPSHLVANLNIDLEGRGPEQKFVNQGWFSKRMNRIWPF